MTNAQLKSKLMKALKATNPEDLVIFNSTNKFIVIYENFLAEKFHGEYEKNCIFVYGCGICKTLIHDELQLLLPDTMIFTM